MTARVRVDWTVTTTLVDAHARSAYTRLILIHSSSYVAVMLPSLRPHSESRELGPQWPAPGPPPLAPPRAEVLGGARLTLHTPQVTQYDETGLEAPV